MIEEVVPPLAPVGPASPTVVESSTVDHDRPWSEVLTATRAPLTLRLPESVMEELRWVADQEGCDVTEIVVSAIDEFLADHWVRNSDF